MPMWRRLLRRKTPMQRMRGKLLRMMPKGGVCVEIGVFQGDFSARILRVTRPRTLHLVDPWRHEPDPAYGAAWYGGDKGQAFMDEVHRTVEKRFQREVEAGQVVLHRMDSAAAASRFEDESLDWVYIDGNHLYEYVKADLEAFLPRLRPGGYLTGDDYGEGGWWEGGVKRAVDEFLIDAPVEAVLIRDGQFILRKS